MSSLGSGSSALLPSVTSNLSCPAPKRLLRMMGAIVAVCLLGSAAAHAMAAPNTWTVNTTADDAAGVAANCVPGSSNSCTLRDAITAANAHSGDAITFTVTGTITLTSALPAISANMSITGPGAGQTTVSGANSYPVFTIGSGAAAAISGLTIANGNAALHGSAGYCGGGIFVASSATLTLAGSNLRGNHSSSYGGGICNFYGTLTVSGSTFTGNTSSSLGGGLITKFGTLAVRNSTFAGNTTGSYGGGIENFHGTATLTNNTIAGNTASQCCGGGVENDNGTLTAANNIVSGNSAASIADDIDGGYSDSGGNLVGYADGVSVDPAAVQLLPLANYGGPTETMMPEPGSAAICAGLATNLPSGMTTDQRGWPMSPSTCPSAYVDAGSVQTNAWIVNTLADSLNTADIRSCSNGFESATNTCSLRDAISQANAASQADVVFAPSLFASGTPPAATPGTIWLGLGASGDIPLPEVTGTLILIGPGANLLTVSGDTDSNVGSILRFAPAATGYVTGMTFSNGLAIPGDDSSLGGGAIVNQGTLTVDSDVFTANQSQDLSGGAIANAGTISILDSTFSANASGNYGGAFINCCAATATVVNSTFTGNTSSSDGGAIFSASKLTVANSTITGNTAKAGAGGGINTNCAGASSAINNSIIAGNSATGSASLQDVGYASCGVAPEESNDVIGLPQGITKASQILGSLALSPATAAVPVMMPLPGTASILCSGSASLLPAGVITDERGFPMDPECQGTIDLGAVQTNYTGIAFSVPNGVVGQNLTPSPAISVQETNALTGAVDGAGGLMASWWLTGYPAPYTGSPLKPTHGISMTKLTKTSSGGVDNLVTLTGHTLSTAGTYTMTAQAGVMQQESNSFTIDPATVTQLVFTAPPASTVSAGAGQSAVKVSMESVNGFPITSATGNITLVVTGPNSYANSYTVAAVYGTATFSPKMLTVAGTYSYQAYVAANPALATDTRTQYVAALAAARLVINNYPPLWWAGVPAYATVSAFDKFGNLSSNSVTTTIKASDSKAVVNPAQVTISGSTQVSVTFPSAASRPPRRNWLSFRSKTS